MKISTFRGYVLLTGLGFIVAIVVGLVMYILFHDMITQYSGLSKKTYKDDIEYLSKNALANMAEYTESRYPVLYDTERLKREAGTDWFWETADEWYKIAQIFNLGYIYYIEKIGDNYKFLMSSAIRKDEHPEWLDEWVWDGAPPAFYNEAWETKQLTISPEPYSDRWGTVISAARPIVLDGKVLGILGVDFEVSFLKGNLQQELLLEEHEKILLGRIKLLLFVCIILSIIFVVYQLWLSTTAVLIPAQEDEVDKRMRLMLEAAPLSCTLWDTDGNLIDCNGDTLRVYGLSRKPDYLEHFYDFNPEYQPNGESTRDEVTRLAGKVLETGYGRTGWMARTVAGEELPFESTLVRIPWKGGYRIAVYSRDLREEKAKEAALQESEKRLQTMLDNMSIPCYFFDPEGKLIDCNQQAVNLFGFTDKQEFLEEFFSLMPEQQSDGRRSRRGAKEFIISTFETGKKNDFFWEMLKRDGTQLMLEVTLIRISWKDGYRVIAYNKDMSELVETEDNLRRVLATAEASPNLNFFIGVNGNVEYMNAAVSDVSGYTREALLWNGLSLIFSPEDFQRLNREYIAAALRKETVHFEMPLVAKNGDKRDIYFSVFSVDLSDGSTGVALMGNDITEAKQIQRDLAAAKEQAEHALESEIQYNKAKSDFLSRVSHELRTPLNAIVGITTVAKNLYDRTELERSFEKISIASEELLYLVNNVLDLTSFDTDKFDFRPMPFSLRKALQSVIGKYTKKAGIKSQCFVATIDNRIQDQVIGDERRVKQVLDNLLSNAVKFTPEKGHIELFARMKESSDNECVVCFDVTDDGIGITGDVLENLGEIFEQADNSITREYGGMGLGLALTKRIVKMMQGDIKVESEPGKGSRFSCTLRMGLAKEEAEAEKTEDMNQEAENKTNNGDEENAGENTGETGESSPASMNLNGKRILIVDDVDLNREILCMMLQDSGATLDEAADGEEAVRMFSRNKYDLVFMDLHMPVMNGYNATKNIRALPLLWANVTPIISVSAESSMELHAKCREVGINDHISKPVDAEVMYEKIAKWLPRTND